MFFEYMRLLDLINGSPLSFEFITNVVLLMLCGLALVLVGFKIKGIWGSVFLLAAGTFLFLYWQGIVYF